MESNNAVINGLRKEANKAAARPRTPRTNEQAIKQLAKALDNAHPFMAAIVRERIMKISEITKAAIEKNPAAYDNPFYNHTYYLEACKIIDETLKFD